MITIIIKYTHVTGTFLKSWDYFSRKSPTSLQIHFFFTFASDNVCRRVKFFAKASKLFTLAAFHVVVVARKTASSECILQGAKKMEVTCLFGRTLPICCFNFFNVCTYRSELIVAPVLKNCTKEIPSLSQKKLAVALPAEGCAFHLFSRVLQGK